jgi:hypothetical protein
VLSEVKEKTIENCNCFGENLVLIRNCELEERIAQLIPHNSHELSPV